MHAARHVRKISTLRCDADVFTAQFAPMWGRHFCLQAGVLAGFLRTTIAAVGIADYT
jgi:hypothetical protein